MAIKVNCFMCHEGGGTRMSERGFTNESILKIIDKGFVKEQVYKGQ
jgi:hypothetical protein